MAVTWTSDQQKVIDSRNRNLLVSAAAGSGKTAVLVERIVKMVTDEAHPVDLDRLLVMTFTNAAAGEMRERIGRAITGKLQEAPDNARLRLQAALVPHAQIQTIDSFCLSLIRNHYAGLDIDPSFRVGDEGELTLLKADVMAELLEDHYESGQEAFERFVETYGSGKTDMGIEEVIDQVYRFSVSHPWPKEWLNRCRQEFEAEGVSHFQESPWVQFLLQDVKLQMEEFKEQLSEALLICQEPDGPEGYLPMIRQDLELVSWIGSGKSFEELQNRLSGAAFGRLAAIRKKDISKEKKEAVAAVRDRVKKAVSKCREQYASQTAEEIQEGLLGCAPAVLMLLDLAEEFMDRYQQAKKERNLVDFGDLEHYALQVLYEDGAPSAAADELSRRYEEILVDEYQDSNYVQEALLEAISRERFGTPNVFMVGDVKQSIYRFRQARPELFLKKYESYSREESRYQKIELRKNFRSRSQVLESINQVFYQIMTSNLGGIRYTKETALYPGAAFQPLPEGVETGADPYQTELFVVNTGSKELSSLDEEARDLTSREIEVKLAVREIRRLTDPETGLLVWDKEANQYRRARYGDIVILLRSLSGWAEIFVNGLMNEGIPAYAQSQAGYFDTTEVETMLSLLAVIDNPIQDIPLAAVMRSPMIGMTDEELAWMSARFKHKAEKGQDRGIYGAWRLWLEEPGEGNQQESAIYEKLCRLDDMITRFRDLAGIFPIHQLLEQIYRETGYYAYVSAMPAGETRQANLDLLIEKAAAYESTSYQGLFHFIRYIERLKKVETDFGEAAVAGAEDRTVRIMSIHKSKGLEFPIVILAGMGKRFNKQDAYSRLLIDVDFGVGADYMDLEQRLKSVTLKKQVLKRRLELESMGEELRVLYVAMTRAKEKLILTAADSYLENKLEKWGISMDEKGRMVQKAAGGPLQAVPYTLLTGAGSYLDWIFMALPRACRTISCLQIPAADFIGQEVLRQMEKQSSRDMLMQQADGTVFDEAYRSRLEEALHYQYPYQEDTRLYAMMSVSELKRRSQELEGGEAAELFPDPLEEEKMAGQLPDPLEEEKMAGQLPDPLEEEGTTKADASAEGEGGGAAQDERKGEELKASRRSYPPAASGAVRGTAYHRALELISISRCHSLKDVVRSLQELTDSGRFLMEARKLVNARVLWNFFQSPLGQRLGKGEMEGRLHKEQQFMIGVPAREMDLADSDELVLIQGMIDAYLEEEDGLVLVDYKTDRVEQGQELIKRYQVQINYYIRALEQVTGRPVKEAVIYSLHLQEEIAFFS
ncbi:MAG: helicase-exonuclease AddAB subunit AddA [Lachnospiraceae bacterium]|nr:helicase-exonuclease AddAB subunit AddA [Lachnospiraceae bacterium]